MKRRVRNVVCAIALLLALLHSAGVLTPLFRPGGFRPDFAVFWTAAQGAMHGSFPIYDAQAMTAAQSWLVSPDKGLRPFVYPPTALLIFAPFATLPFFAAWLVWTLMSLAAFYMAARRLVTRNAVLLSLVSPPVVLALSSGQTSLLVGAAITGAISLLDRRPVLAGLLFGAAAALKPQALILLPVALIVGHHWRAMLASLVTALLLCVAATGLWGRGLWSAWVGAIQDFAPIVASLQLESGGIALAMLARAAGWPSSAGWLLQLMALACGVAITIRAFRRNDKPLQLIALLGGSLFGAPYALGYDLAPLMPIAALMLLSGKDESFGAAWPFTGLAGVAAVPLLAASRLTVRMSDRTALSSTSARPDQHRMIQEQGAE